MYHQNKDYVQTAIYIKLKMRNMFLIECPKYEEERKSLFESASILSIHFNDLLNYYKLIWIMSNENETLIKELGIFFKHCF